MNGNSIFWLAVGAMTAVAFGFIAKPLLASSRKTVLVGLAVAAPAVAIIIYIILGSPPEDSEGQRSHESVAPDVRSAGKRPDTNVASVASMVDGLAARLAEDPNDADSWLLLARSYNHLDRTQDALSAYAKATALGRSDADLEALATRGEGSNAAEIEKAQIFGNVSLTAAATKIVEPTDTVFIFARAVDGPPMPAAVLRRSASDLPLDFLLNDSQSMVSDVKLSDFEQVIVTARITRSGDAMSALQGLEAKSDPILVADNRHLTLIIEQNKNQ